MNCLNSNINVLNMRVKAEQTGCTIISMIMQLTLTEHDICCSIIQGKYKAKNYYEANRKTIYLGNVVKSQNMIRESGTREDISSNSNT